MYSRITTIKNKTGLHARPASEFVAAAGKFKSKLIIRRPGDETVSANAKSIVMLLSLALGPGKDVEIIGNGEDEIQAVDTLVALIDSGFGE